MKIFMKDKPARQGRITCQNFFQFRGQPCAGQRDADPPRKMRRYCEGLLSQRRRYTRGLGAHTGRENKHTESAARQK